VVRRLDRRLPHEERLASDDPPVARGPAQCTLVTSTSNTSVARDGTVPGWPAAP
jgi:hypothetical protein